MAIANVLPGVPQMSAGVERQLSNGQGVRICYASLLVMMLTAWQPDASAGTLWAASPSRTDVGAAVAAADTGDIVLVPAGTATWTTQLTVTKGITLKGAGAGLTVIVSALPQGYGSFLLNYAPIDRASDPPFAVTGFTFDGNWNTGCVAVLRGSYPNSLYLTKVRIHHNTFTRAGGLSGRAIYVDGLTFGVIDHNTFINNDKTFDAQFSNSAGWAVPIDLGGPNSMYFEDNVIINNDSRVSALTSGGQGGRYVWRYNSVDTTSPNADKQHLDMHGAADDRGTVSAEIYGNTLVTKASAWQLLDHRGGTAIVFNNKVVKPSGSIALNLREEDTGTYPILDQVTGSYYWNNTYGAVTGLENVIVPAVTQGATYVQLDRDYFTPASGLESDRQTACAVGALYAATDSGRLYRCSEANVWSVKYQPYTYPHPLARPGLDGPAAPTSVRVVP